MVGPQHEQKEWKAHEKDVSPAQEARRLLAELLGTFALTSVAAGAEVIAVISGGEVGQAARAVAPGLLVMAFIYAMGDVSGAHFNPAVTFAFALRGAFPWSRLPGYCLAQLAGALAAAGLLRILFGDVAHLGATTPKHGEFQSLVMEILLTWLLVTVILGTATRYQLIGPSAALAVGATIALCGLFAGPVSGASMNPARSLGPAIVSGEMASAWISVAGPSVGASAAVLVAWILKGNKRPQEDKAAEG